MKTAKPYLVKTHFLYIEFDFSPDGTITPVVHYDPITTRNKTVFSHEKVSFPELHLLNVSIGNTISIMVTGDISAEIVSVSGIPFVHLPVPDKCPCCKCPIDNTQMVVHCLNQGCPEKPSSKFDITNAPNVLHLGTDFGSVSEIRYAASSSSAIVLRKSKQSKAPAILYFSSGQIDTIMYNAGLIHNLKSN